jgi:hypothetical protein
MREFSRAFDVDAPPDRVWRHMRDVERWHEWTASVTRIRILGGGPLRAGARAFVRQPKLPPAMWKVSELDDPGRNFTWISAAPGLRVRARHGVEARGPGSRATLSLAYEGMLGGWMARLLGEITGRYLDLEAAGLKRRSERG